MLVATRPRPRVRPAPLRVDTSYVQATPAILTAALLREHDDAGAMLGGADFDACSDLAPVLHELSREARGLAQSLVVDGGVTPQAPVDAPTVVLTRDLAVAQRSLRRALATPPSRAHCAMLEVSLARVAELRDVVAAALEGAPST